MLAVIVVGMMVNRLLELKKKPEISVSAEESDLDRVKQLSKQGASLLNNSSVSPPGQRSMICLSLFMRGQHGRFAP